MKLKKPSILTKGAGLRKLYPLACTGTILQVPLLFSVILSNTLLSNTKLCCRSLTTLQNLVPISAVTAPEMLCCHCALNSDLNRLW